LIGSTLQAYSQNATRAEVLRGGLRPERDCYDVFFYDLEVQPDLESKSISGVCKIHFAALTDFEKMQADLFANMQIDSIRLNGADVSWTRDFDAVFIATGQKITKDSRGVLTVVYHGKPLEAKNPPWDGGFIWKKDASGKPWVGVACQGTGASLWWPCKDHQSDEPDSMRIACIVPSDLRFVSNGNESQVTVLPDGKTRYEWKVSYPINNYNVTLNIGDYVHLHDVHYSSDGDSLDLDYYVLRENAERSLRHFEQVKPMLSCYERFLGKYPFYRDGYALVETAYLGMEHQGAIAYGNKFKTGYSGMDRSGMKLPFDYIIIHETGHEWWGNSVTSADIADMWIHESFCTYSEAIYVECLYGYDTAMTYVNALRSTVSNSKPMIGTYGLNREGHSDMYVKGMLFLNTLRHVIANDDIWWPMIKNMSDTTFKYQITDYDQVTGFFCEKTGMPLTPLFEQYVKKPGLPALEYSITSKRNKVCMKYRWRTDVQGFEMPVELTHGGEKVRITPTDRWQTVVLKGAPVFDDRKFYYKRTEVR
jgi:aminopeptidase N